MTINYELALIKPPLSLDDYAVEASPEGYEPAGAFIGAILTSASGKRYQGCRGYNEIIDNRSRIYPFNRLDTGSLNGHAPKLWEEVMPPGTSEPYSVERRADEYVYSTEHSKLRVRPDSWDWLDFDGRWDLNVKRVGDPYLITVPRQDDWVSGQLHRGELGFAEGTVDGEPVRGVTFLMYTFSDKGSGQKFINLPLINKMNNGWLIWMVEFEDGGLIAGEGRRGKPGTGWQMSFLYKDGVSRLTKQPTIEMTHAQNGPVNGFSLELDDLSLHAVTDSCSVWPHVVFGHVDRISDPRPIKNSWSNLEWYPKNYKELLAGLMEKKITTEAMLTARVIDERVLIPGLLE